MPDHSTRPDRLDQLTAQLVREHALSYADALVLAERTLTRGDADRPMLDVFAERLEREESLTFAEALVEADRRLRGQQESDVRLLSQDPHCVRQMVRVA
jgi:hypothetical protein